MQNIQSTTGLFLQNHYHNAISIRGTELQLTEKNIIKQIFELNIVNLEQMIILHRYKISIIHWRHSEFCTKAGI